MRLKMRIKWLLPAAAAAGLAVFFLAGLDGGLTVRSYTVESGKVTAPVRLAVLTDLHACDYGEGQRELLDAVAAQAPDLVLLVGDIVDDEPRMPEARALETVAALAEGSVSQETLFARTAAHFSIDLHNMSRIHIFDRIFHSITTYLEETGQLECVYEGDRLCYRRPKDAALSKSPSCKGVHPAP